MHRIEKIILENLLKNDDYIRKVVPFLQEEYFFDSPDKKVFGAMKAFVEKYNNTPTKQALKIALDDDKTLNEETHKQCMEIIDTLNGNDVDYQEIYDSLKKRDDSDINREISPLKIPNNAHILDTSYLKPDAIVDKILNLYTITNK